MNTDEAARWAALIGRAQQAVFLLDRQRRLRLVNPPFEQLTGQSAADLLGLLCTSRRSDHPLADLSQALAPPPEVLAGHALRVRRGPSSTQPIWEVQFTPFTDASGFLGAIGLVQVLSAAPVTDTTPLSESLSYSRERLARRHDFDLLALRMPVGRRIAAQARLASATREAVLIVGPAGSGKLTFARVVHHQGLTRTGSFLTLDARGLPHETLTDILFGPHGLAGAGTVYLRDPAALPADVQSRLADWLNQRDPLVGPRVVAGCRQDPEHEIAESRFLPALAQALEVVSVRLPRLADRAGDLPRLADRFLERWRGTGATSVTGLTASAWEAVLSFAWPGNIRQFEQVLRAAALRARGSEIDRADLPPEVRGEPGTAPVRGAWNLDVLLEQVERRLIEMALRRQGGNKSRAAEMLSVWRTRLLRRMEALGINDSEAKE